MRSCKETTELISKSLDKKLSFWQRLSLTTHAKMCKFCNNYQRQLELIKNFFKRSSEEEILENLCCPDDCLDDNCQEKIKAAIKKKLAEKE